jgi:hypothetical protein
MSRKRSPSFSISFLQMCSSLAFLRRGQVHAGVAVVGAGIDPLRVEPEGVEVVGDVVVELDLLGVDLGRCRACERARRPSCCSQPTGGATATTSTSVGSPAISSAARAITSRMPPSMSIRPST